MKKPKESWRQLATRYIDKLLSCLPEKDCKKEQGHSCLQPCQTLWQAVKRRRWRQIWQATHQPSRTLTALRVHSHCKALEEHQKLRNPQKLLLIYTLWRMPKVPAVNALSHCTVVLKLKFTFCPYPKFLPRARERVMTSLGQCSLFVL